jgi:SPP1 gp7 family putative phage head morphogenesis protein
VINFPESDPRGTQLRLIVERMKYERWLANETADLLEREFNRLVDVLTSTKYRTLTAAQRARALELYRELDRILKSGYVDVTDLHLTEMRGYAQFESDVARVQAASLVEAGTGVAIDLAYRLPNAYLESIAKLPIQGLRISEWFEAQAQTMSVNVRRIIQQGLVEGLSPVEISRRILADDRAKGPVLSRRAKNEAKIISRTTVNAVQNDATRKSYEQLPASVSDSWRFAAVRDDRTTIICLALDGRVFRFDDPTAPWPPRHIGCRSTSMPLIKGAEMTLAQQKGLPLTYGSMSDWLSAQPVTTQNDLLGVTRAGFWRDGKMSLSDAIDADSRVLTLKQLRERLLSLAGV